MTSFPDPDPDKTPGLEPGGGVAPGDTPPGEASTSGVSHPQGQPSRVGNLVTLVLIILVTVAVLAFIVLHLIGWFDVL
ncbi:MAG TPA: DUF6480 family protein [Pseudonocardiaceae bacterium]